MAFDIDDIINVSGSEANIDKVIQKLGELDKVIAQINKQQITLGNVSNFKELQTIIDAITKSQKELSKSISDITKAQNESVAGTKKVVDAYGQLKKEVSDAERYFKNMATIYGADSKQALEAANSLNILKQRLNEVNAAAKNSGKITTGVEVVGSSDNLSQLEEERQRTISATGDVVSQLEKQEAAAANEATSFANSQKSVGEETATAMAVIEQELTVIEQLAQTVVSTKAELSANATALKENAAAYEAGTISEAAYLAEATRLTAEQATLKNVLSQTNAELNNQVKTNLTAAGSLAQLGLQLSAAKQQYQGFTEAQRNSTAGKELFASIEVMDAAFKKQKAAIGENQASVGDYEGAIKRATSSSGGFAASANNVYGIIRKLAQILPGVGIAGIFALAIDPISDAVKELLDYESAEDAAKRQTALFTEELKEQNDALNKNITAIKNNTNEVLAELRRRGATANEVNEAINAGLSQQEQATINQGQKLISEYNKQIDALNKVKLTAEEVSAIAKIPGKLSFDFKGLSESDLKDSDKVKAYLDDLSKFKLSRDFEKLPDAIKAQVTNISASLSQIFDTSTKSSELFEDRFLSTVNYIADAAVKLREANKQAAENAVNAQADINARNRKAQIDYAAQSLALRQGEFEARKAQIEREAAYELNAETDKIKKINAIRAIELSQPGLDDADRLRINSQADAEIKQATLTAEQRKAIRAKANAALYDLDKEFALRNAEAIEQITAIQLQTESKQYDELSKDLELSLDDRLAATKKYADDQRKILDAEFELQKKRDSYTSLTSEEKLQREKEYESKVLQLNIDTNQRVTDSLRQEIDKRKELQDKSLQDIERLFSFRDLGLSTQYSEDVIALNNSLKSKQISIEKYDKKRRDIDYSYSISVLENTDSNIREQLKLYDGAETFLRSQQSVLEGLQSQLTTAATDGDKKRLSDDIVTQKKLVQNAKESVDKKIQLEKQLNTVDAELSDERIKKDEQEKERRIRNIQLVVESFDILNQLQQGLGDAGYTKRINAIEDEKQALEDRYGREVELINQTVAAGTARDQALAEAAKRKAAQDKVLDQQERQQKLAQARFDKEAAIFSIIIGGAQAIVRDLGNPFKIALDAALTAAQLAVAIATPLPRFFKGKNIGDKYQGYAWVDDGADGRGKAELIERADGRLEVGTNKPRITWLDANDKVFPDAQTELVRRSMIQSRLALIPLSKAAEFSDKNLIQAIRAAGRETVRAIKSIPQPKTPSSNPMNDWFKSNLSSEEFYKRMN